jgi:hypothetical protein
MTVLENTVELEVVDFEVEGFGNTESEETFEATPALAGLAVAVVAKKDNSDLYKGIGIGLLAGALLGATAWFYERKKRMDLLKQLERTTFIAAGLASGKDVVTYGKEEIKLSVDMMSNPDDLILTIKNNLDKVKMSKKEKLRWIETMENLIELTLVWDLKGKATTITNEATETLVEN